MSHATNGTVTVSSPAFEAPEALVRHPMYQAATAHQRRVLLADYTAVVVGDGLPEAEYLEGLTEYGASGEAATATEADRVADYIAESWELRPDGSYCSTYQSAADSLAGREKPPVVVPAPVATIEPAMVARVVDESNIRRNVARLVGTLDIARDASPEQRAVLEADAWTVHYQDGLPWAEYEAGMASYATLAEFLATRSPKPAPAEGIASDAAVAAVVEALAVVEAAAALEAKQRVAVAAPAAAPVDPAAVAAAVAAARAAEEAAEEAARKEAQHTLDALIKAYRRGERQYARGLLESGRLAAVYIAQRLALKATRENAVQVITGDLAKYARSTVDVSQLIRCWTAYDLLAVSQGMDVSADGKKPAPAAEVPYDHYRQAWSLLLLRQHKDKATEHWTLLTGMEAECKALYRKSTLDALDRKACIEQCQALVAEYGRREQRRLAEAATAKARDKALAQTKADEERAATQSAEQERKAAEAALRAAVDAAKAETDPAVKAAAEEAARQAAATLEASRKAEQEQRDKDAAATKEANRLRQEAETAQKARDKADEVQRKADEAARKKAAKEDAPPAAPKDPTPAPKPVAECRGENVVKSVQAATTKDAGSMLALAIQGHREDPLAVLYETVANLLDTPPKGHTPDAVARALFTAMHHAASVGYGTQVKSAIQAAHLTLARKDAEAEKPATVKAPEAPAAAPTAAA